MKKTAARLTATLMLAGGALGVSAGAATAEDFDRDYAFSPPVSEWNVAPQETDWQVAPLEIDWN
ncbi:hypothetical protein [Streptomyces sp. B8F3]|uniref:hypothetical protein n=1 Tax=unclassified Streptomyces TaxID=2593676 RepID=UPI00325D21CD